MNTDKNKLLQYIAILLLVFLSNAGRAQYYTSGADPASIQWYKIETENFKVVFPERFSEKGQYIAKVLEEIYKSGGNSLNHKPRKISVLIHSETAYSNGFVTWAPKRIELYSTPHQDMYAQDWLQQLGIHEFRHVVQIDKLNTGFTNMMSYIFGEQAVGAVLGMYVPMWFLEGDAVATETALTQSGRGRSPAFEQAMKAQVLDKKLYSYEKAMFGSYKDFVPDHYEMGYQLVAGARAKYGKEIWESALFNTGRNSQGFTPFNSGQKKVSGINKVSLYKEVFGDLKQKWDEQNNQTNLSTYHPITSTDSRFVNFEYPLQLDTNLWVASISGPGEVRRFVKVNANGDYENILTPGNRNREPFSLWGHVLCWAQLEPDARWENRMYSVIKTYDLDTHKLNKISYKSRLFSPALHPDGKRIAAVEVDSDNSYSLVLIDKDSGDKVNEFSYGDNNYLFTPSWNKQGNKLVCIALSEKGKSIVVLNTETGQWQEVLAPSFKEISLARWGDQDDLYFTGTYSGKEEIYIIRNGEVFQLTQSKYGATSATVSENELVYAHYTSDGYQLVKTKIHEENWIPVAVVKDHSPKLYKTISEQEQEKPDFSSIDDQADYSVSKYSKWNLFQPHSWAPAFVNIEDTEVRQGISVQSQNLLGTAITTVGWNADPQYTHEKYYVGFEYQGWYPVLSMNMYMGDYQEIKEGFYVNATDTFYSSGVKNNRFRMETGISLPLNFSRTNHSVYLKPSVQYNLIKEPDYAVSREKYTMVGNYLRPVSSYNLNVEGLNDQSLEYSLYFHRLKYKAARDVAYRWGQVAELVYQHSPWGNINRGGIAGLFTRLYLPGIGKHDALRLDNAYQYKTMGDQSVSNNQYVFNTYGDYFTMPRGYIAQPNDKMYSFKGDYIFPLSNPDLTIPGVLYLKRINCNLFFDYSQTQSEIRYTSGQSNHHTQNYISTGIELKSEAHLFRFMFPVTIGYRVAELIHQNHQIKHELLLGLNISGFSIGK